MSAVDFIRHLPQLGRHYATHRRRLRALAYSWCRDRALAEDLVQDTFLKALNKLSQLREVEALESWLFNILLNCWRDHLRRLRPTEEFDELNELVDAVSGAEHSRQELADNLRAAVAQLPEGQRQVLCLVDLEGYSYAEVSRILDIPTGTVTSRISRARESLRSILTSQEAPGRKVVSIRRTG